jgi:1-acyl-sn-glycerol-3-phosphate acyltransferase
MSHVRPVVNAGHAAGWTVFISSIALAIFGVTRNRKVFRQFTRVWAEVMAQGWGMRVKAVGTEHVHHGETYVFICNHQSHADIVSLFVALPINVGFLAKKELKRVPFLAQAMVAGGHVFIDRSRRNSALKAMEEAADEVARGDTSIVIFPEGTRGQTSEIQPFKSGGFHLARNAKVRVVPVGLRGTREIQARGELGFKPGLVEVHVGAPVDPHAYPTVQALMEDVRARVSSLAAMPMADRS